MTDSQNATQPAEAEVQARLKDLEEENELLLLQLHQVQEELENYFLKCQELEKGGGSAYSGSTPVGGWVDDELPSLHAEVSRLTALVKTQSRLREIEAKNALNARLGDILIQSVSPSGSLVGLPGKLMGIWRASKAEQPSAALGGKNFDKVIEAFQKGGLEPVNQLLAAEPAPEMRAKAYTALARQQMKNGLFKDAALSARRAYEEEPKPFRLKWLAFRLHDAGEIAEADACLSLLPQDTSFSDSEARQRDQVRYEAKSARLREAKQKTGFESRRQAMENQMQTLRRDCDQHARLAAEREAEIKSLQQAHARLEQEKSALVGQHEESANLAAARLGEIETLNQVLNDTKQEKAGLTAQLEDSTRLSAERQAKIDSLRQELDRLNQEKAGLSAKMEESAKLSADRQSEIETLLQTLASLEQDKKEMASRQEESANLLATRQAEIESLQQVLAQRERDGEVLTGQHEDVVRQVAERQAEIDSLRQAAGKFEQERAELKKLIDELTRQRDEQSRLAQDRIRQIEELQRKAHEREAAESELATRQQIICEEMVKAEAQLDLMKDILLRESIL